MFCPYIKRPLRETKPAWKLIDAMIYQTAKEIGAMATVLDGDVDAVLLTGGIANDEYITGQIEKRVKFIAPVFVYPGEREMLSLGPADILCFDRKRGGV